MKKKLILGMAKIALFIISCDMIGKSGFKETESGLQYKFHYQSGDTISAEIEELVTMNMTYRLEDSILYTSVGAARPMVLVFKESDYPGDIYEGIGMMKVGDSATFMTRADSFFLKTARSQSVPEFVEPDAMMYFDIKLLAAETQEAFQAGETERDKEMMYEEQVKLEKYLDDYSITIEPGESGLYFVEERNGNGPTPVNGDWIKVNFDITLLDGTPVYSTTNAPIEFQYGQTFDTEGFTEGVGMMKKGGKALLIVPSAIGLGKPGRGEMVPPFSTLLYDTEIVDIMSANEYAIQQEQVKTEKAMKDEQNAIESDRFLRENKIKEGITELPSGLQYKIVIEGSGPKPALTDQVKVHYHGTLIDGTIFDSSVDRGTPSSFTVNGVIAGWTEALQLMPVGSKWILYIPSELAYGSNARGDVIEANMALVFEVELLEIVNK